MSGYSGYGSPTPDLLKQRLCSTCAVTRVNELHRAVAPGPISLVQPDRSRPAERHEEHRLSSSGSWTHRNQAPVALRKAEQSCSQGRGMTRTSQSRRQQDDVSPAAGGATACGVMPQLARSVPTSPRCPRTPDHSAESLTQAHRSCRARTSHGLRGAVINIAVRADKTITGLASDSTVTVR